MGGRLIRGWLERPLLSPVQISRRQQAVGDLVENSIARQELSAALREVTDLERLIGRVVYGSAGGRDLSALCAGLGKLRILLQSWQQKQPEKSNKNPPAQPGVFHRRVQPFDTSLHVTSCEYDLPAAKVLLLATR